MPKVSTKPRKKSVTVEETQMGGFRGNPKLIGETTNDDIVNTLVGYKNEAVEARKSGPNPRDDKWNENLDLYWGRYDFSAKANWQAKETMPEVPGFVDRFAAALKEAIMASPEGFYTIKDPSDTEGDISSAIKRATDVWLSTTGRNQNGSVLPFPAVFEEQVKMGAIMACASVTTWKEDYGKGRVAIETVDPRNVWLDHTYRNLYRIRRIEIDRHELNSMVDMEDSKGNPIFNLDEVSHLVGQLQQEEQQRRTDLTGHGNMVTSTRNPIVLDEYVATVVGPDGKTIANKGLFVVANDRFLVRGPEANPFWHKKDWLTFTPLVTGPRSVYGRSYMEDFGSVAKTFNELTNMLLDAVHTSSLNAYVVVPSMLANPNQLAEGITPNKAFLLEEGFDPKMFAQKLELGTLPPDAIRMWSALKNELREAASMNEIGVGQLAPKSRTSATEIVESQQNSSALIKSMAETIETGWLNVNLDLVWKTGLQHVKPDDEMIRAAMGPEMFDAIYARRKEFVARNVTFQARGISDIIQKSKMLHALIQILGIIAQNEILLKAFLQEVDITLLVNKLFELSNIDLSKLKVTDRERLIRSATEPLNAAQDRANAAGSTSPAAAQTGQGIAQALGVGK